MEAQFYTVDQAAGILGTKENIVRTYCREGKMPSIRVGRGYRIARADLERWIKEQKEGTQLIRQEEQRLIDAEARYRNLFENTSDTIALFDIKGCLILANPRFYEVYGWTSKEAEGVHFTRFVYTEDLPLATERFMKRIAGEDVEKHYEARALRRDGEVFEVEISSSSFMKEGKPSGVQAIIRDISERRKAEMALKESEARYRAVVEDQSELVCRWLPGGKLTFVNEAYCRFFGKTREELLGRSFMHLIPKEDHEAVKDYFAALSAKNPVASHEHRVIAPDGEIRWVQWTNHVILDDRGRVLEFQDVGRDVTDRRRAENKLRESEEMYKMLVKASPEAVTATDLEGNITFVSPKTLQLHGFKRAEDLLGESVFLLIAPEYHDLAMANLQKTLNKGWIENVQYELLRADGTKFAGELSTALIRDVEEKPMMFIATTRDITERKRAEEERNRLLKAIEVSSEGISILDSNREFVYVNAAFSRIHGYKAEELMGKSWKDVVPAEDVKEMEKKVEEALHLTGMWKGPCEAVRKDSKKVWVRLSITVLKDDKGQPTGYTTVVRDYIE